MHTHRLEQLESKRDREERKKRPNPKTAKYEPYVKSNIANCIPNLTYLQTEPHGVTGRKGEGLIGGAYWLGKQGDRCQKSDCNGCQCVSFLQLPLGTARERPNVQSPRRKVQGRLATNHNTSRGVDKVIALEPSGRKNTDDGLEHRNAILSARILGFHIIQITGVVLALVVILR